uniref:Uncharacterized protein n=1 Tax=Knipowitschia caucasica TaxID=637954 RepID=A0AAV2K6C1_KNICA
MRRFGPMIHSKRENQATPEIRDDTGGSRGWCSVQTRTHLTSAVILSVLFALLNETPTLPPPPGFLLPGSVHSSWVSPPSRVPGVDLCSAPLSSWKNNEEVEVVV